MIDLVFETKRLLVRRWRDSDLPYLMAVYGDEDAMKWVGDGKPLNETACAEWLNVTNRNYTIYGYGMFAVELKYESGVIGFCGIVIQAGKKRLNANMPTYGDFGGKVLQVRLWSVSSATASRDTAFPS